MSINVCAKRRMEIWCKSVCALPTTMCIFVFVRFARGFMTLCVLSLCAFISLHLTLLSIKCRKSNGAWCLFTVCKFYSAFGIGSHTVSDKWPSTFNFPRTLNRFAGDVIYNFRLLCNAYAVHSTPSTSIHFYLTDSIRHFIGFAHSVWFAKLFQVACGDRRRSTTVWSGFRIYAICNFEILLFRLLLLLLYYSVRRTLYAAMLVGKAVLMFLHQSNWPNALRSDCRNWNMIRIIELR